MSDETVVPEPERAAARFAELPERVDPDSYVEGVDVSDVPDPEFGRDPNKEWMLKYV